MTRQERARSRSAPWLTLVAGVVGSAASSGAASIVLFGLTLKLIAADFGWSRSEVSVGIAAFYLCNGLGAFLLGMLVVRFRIRRPAIAFVVLYALSSLAVAMLPPALWLFAMEAISPMPSGG